VIAIQELQHQYKHITAINGISLDVRKGELHGLIGPDGAGKSTLMRLLCGLRPIQQGQVSVLGMDLRTEFRQIRARLGYMPQRFSLYQDLSVQENLFFFARLFSISPSERDKRISELYAFSHLEEFKTRRAGALSGGMKQKLALSCALIHSPELMILDEPTYGIDPVSRMEFWQMLKTIQTAGTTILVSTPYMEEAELCDNISLMYGGNLMVSDNPENIIRNWDYCVYRINTSNPKDSIGMIEAYSGVESCQLFGNELHIVIAKHLADKVIGEIENQLAGSGNNFERIKPGMEDIYLSRVQSYRKDKPKDE